MAVSAKPLEQRLFLNGLNHVYMGHVGMSRTVEDAASLLEAW